MRQYSRLLSDINNTWLADGNQSSVGAVFVPLVLGEEPVLRVAPTGAQFNTLKNFTKIIMIKVTKPNFEKGTCTSY